MSDTILIIQFFADVMKQIFLGLDSVKYEGISILDMFLAVIFFRLLVWFILRVLNDPYTREYEDEYREKERPEYREKERQYIGRQERPGGGIR